MSKEKKNPFLKILKTLLFLLIISVILFTVLLVFFLVTDYNPADKESIAVIGTAEKEISTGETFKIVTWNVGHCTFGDNADFFTEGGKSVTPSSKKRTEENLDSIVSFIKSENPSIVFLQETDVSSDLSHRINEAESFRDTFDGFSSTFAYNFKVAFLPYPIPPLGKTASGIMTLSEFKIENAERIQLPIPFKWPVSMISSKKCLSVSRLPVKGADKELVLVNLQLEAYDSDEDEISQTLALKDFLEEEYAEGNYVIAGGDFNQVFSSKYTKTNKLPVSKGRSREIDVSAFNDGCQFLTDESVPSCRSLDRPFEGADPDEFGYYLSDGYIVSENVKVASVITKDLKFINSAHNPVILEFILD